jgi:glyoxylase-like metal-dependent hydrolase (beta-lactamase superfamily II)
MGNPEVLSFFDPDTFTGTHIVIDPESNSCAIVDSVLDYDPPTGRTSTASADKLIETIKSRGLQLELHIETHAHADHLSAAPYLQEQLGGKIVIGSDISIVQETFGKIFNAESGFATDGSQFDQLYTDGDTYQIGNLQGRVIHTPGHTPACMTHIIGDAVFVGDTLFMPDYGTARCDFPGGDAATLYDSVQKIFALPDTTRVFLCHDYLPEEGRTEYALETTLGAEKRENIHIHQGISREEFIEMRTSRDATLDMPVLILPSVQVNIRAGHFPPEEDNGISYLKIPLNAL